MNAKTLALLTALLLSLLFENGCGARQKSGEQISASSGSEKNVNAVPEIQELGKLYSSLLTDRERRAVCLRAIDHGVIRQGAPVSSIDGIFGTHFASDLPKSNAAAQSRWVLFADQPKPLPTQNGMQPASAYVGWYLRFEYDSQGKIQNYYLSNLHKGLSVRTDDKTPTSVSDLRHQYQTAKSEAARRDVCIGAIDEGVIQTFGPVSVSTIDAIFGSRFASALPTEKEATRKVRVDFSAPESGENSKASNLGWHLVVEYDHAGNLADYFLTNVSN